MVERKLYKTRLCQQYQRGRCSRQYCNFAHGDSELRRSFNERPENRGRDLRQRLDRMRSPLQRYSPGRDARVTHSSHGYSPRSIGKRINHSKRQQLDRQGNYSGSLRMSDGSEDQIKDRRPTSSDFKSRMDEQLRQMSSEIKMLDNDKRQLEIYLGDRVQEADTLNLKIHEMEMLLSKEKVESKRITTRIKKFIKAHKRHLRLQEELKRSHAQLQKLGEQLDTYATGPSNEAGPKILDDEAGGKFSSPLNESPINSPMKKRTRNFLEVHDTSNRVNSVNGESTDNGKVRLEKLPRQTGYCDQLTNHKEPNEQRSFTFEDKSGIEISLPSDATSADKYKVSEATFIVPPTGIAAAHAMEGDVVEVNEMEEKLPEVGVASKAQRVPFLPPPPPLIPQNIYPEYKGNGADVDVSGPEEDAVEVDID